MKLFECLHCGQLLYFENTYCERCGHALGYLSEFNILSVLDPDDNQNWLPRARPWQPYRYCGNSALEACNWLVPVDSESSLCHACRLNRTIPDLDDTKYRQQWQRLEIAKHRLVYSLLRLGLPLRNKVEDNNSGLAFDFLAEPEPSFRETAQVITGHAEGVITINIAEADDVERERQRQTMAEPYRTLLGHPWEDWAETWAHYLHIVDTLETAYAFGLSSRPRVGDDTELTVRAEFDPYLQEDFDALIDAWLPLTCAVNSLNRSMGQPDLYPFVLTETALEKLAFIHYLVTNDNSGTMLSSANTLKD